MSLIQTEVIFLPAALGVTFMGLKLVKGRRLGNILNVSVYFQEITLFTICSYLLSGCLTQLLIVAQV